MAVLDHDHSYLQSRPSSPARIRDHGLVCAFGFVMFWVAFFAFAWAMNTLIEKFL